MGGNQRGMKFFSTSIFETRFSEVIDRSKKELLSRYGRGVKGRSGEKSADKKGVMHCRGGEDVY